jgi:hypothetical protein
MDGFLPVILPLVILSGIFLAVSVLGVLLRDG